MLIIYVYNLTVLQSLCHLVHAFNFVWFTAFLHLLVFTACHYFIWMLRICDYRI